MIGAGGTSAGVSVLIGETAGMCALFAASNGGSINGILTVVVGRATVTGVLFEALSVPLPVVAVLFAVVADDDPFTGDTLTIDAAAARC
jgi:hypothetical protein